MAKKQTLAEKQDEMRQRRLLEKRKVVFTPNLPVHSPLQNRPLCSNNCGRYAREGSTLCSRCSFKDVEANLRDVLPGLSPPPASQVKGFLQSTPSPSNGPDPVIEDGSIKQYTRPQVAKILGVRPNTLARWEKKGKTPAPVKIVHSGQYLYSQELVNHLKEYVTLREHVIHPVVNPTVKAAKEVQGKVFKPNKRLERTVSSRLSIGSGRSIL